MIDQLIFWVITLAFVGTVGLIFTLADLWSADDKGHKGLAQLLIILLAAIGYAAVIVRFFPSID